MAMLESNLSGTPILYGEIQREILDVRKEEQDKVVEPTLKDELVVPDTPMQTLGSVLVKGVTANIDENIKPENIKLGTTILGVQGNVAPDKPDQEKTIYPSEEEQIVTADLGYELGKVISKPIQTETIEVLPTKEKQTINASDGKYIKQFEVLGVETEELNIIPTTEAQIFTPSDNKFFDKVNVGAVENIDTELTDQEELLTDLETQVNELSDKPKDMLQQRVDATNSCYYLFAYYNGDTLDFIKGLDTSKVTNMHQMFYSCSLLKNIHLSTFDTGNVTNMNGMFYRCRNATDINISGFNTQKVTNMAAMFQECTALVNVNLSSLDTSNVTTMELMFGSCSNLVELDLSNFDFTKCERTSRMFTSCGKLETIIGVLDLVNVTLSQYLSEMFNYCTNLTNVTLKNIRVNLKIGNGTYWGTKLTNESLINTIKELWDLTGTTSQTLTLSTTSKENIANIYVKLVDVTDEMLAQDEYAGNKKPCVVCESTDEGAMTLTEFATSKNWAIA